MKPLIALDNVYFSYKTGKTFLSKKRKDILYDLSFQINAGETVGVLGRNGAGKSTLLRLLTGVLMPQQGTITVNCKKVNLLSLELGFSEHLTGYKNLILSGLFNGFTKEEILKKTDSILEIADIGDAIHQPLITYSSGMRTRLGFSIAYHLDPDVLLIDEVLGVGDIDFQIKSSNMILEKMNSDQTVVLVSHDHKLIRNICQKAIWIEDGRVKKQGKTDQVVDSYLEATLKNTPTPMLKKIHKNLWSNS